MLSIFSSYLNFYIYIYFRLIWIYRSIYLLLTWIFRSRYIFFLPEFNLNLTYCREHEKLKNHEDPKTQRNAMFKRIKQLVESNPIIRPKLMFPSIEAKRLQELIIQRFCLCPRLFIKISSFKFRTSLEDIYILSIFSRSL